MLLLVDSEVAFARLVKDNSARKDIGEIVGVLRDLALEFRVRVVWSEFSGFDFF